MRNGEHGQCEQCRKEYERLYLVRKLFLSVGVQPIILCEDCCLCQEFFYVDVSNIVRFKPRGLSPSLLFEGV
jgi:hypothetical protein